MFASASAAVVRPCDAVATDRGESPPVPQPSPAQRHARVGFRTRPNPGLARMRVIPNPLEDRAGVRSGRRTRSGLPGRAIPARIRPSRAPDCDPPHRDARGHRVTTASRTAQGSRDHDDPTRRGRRHPGAKSPATRRPRGRSRSHEMQGTGLVRPCCAAGRPSATHRS
jgi:hypothetical protein